MQRFPYAKNKAITIVNGYDQEIFSRKKYDKQLILNKLGITNKYDNIVLLSGRLVHVKGIDILLKAAKIYENENILTLIAGEGILHKELEKLAEDLKLKDVFFLGAKTQTELNELYNIADVTVLSSRYEGLALVVIEALACGTPVVVTNIEAMNGFMKKEFGLVVEKENPQALANGIIKTLSEKEKYKNEEIAEYIKNNYSTKQIIDNIIELYKNCL